MFVKDLELSIAYVAQTLGLLVPGPPADAGDGAL
jgi:hypothetical protein